MIFKKKSLSIFFLFVLSLSFILSPTYSKAQAPSAPTLSPIVESDNKLILDWTDISFNSVNRTYYEVGGWFENPNFLVGRWYPSASELNISLSYFLRTGLLHIAVRGLEEITALNRFGDEVVTSRIIGDLSNIQSYNLIAGVDTTPDYKEKGSFWDREQINPAINKITLYGHHKYFWDKTTLSWMTLDFKERASEYLARNAQTGVRFRDAYTEIFNVESNLTKVGAERWRVQAYIGSSWEFLDLNNPVRSFIHTSDMINLTRTQDIRRSGVLMGTMETILTLGVGYSKYTVNVESSRNGTLRLLWEFSNVDAQKIKYLLEEENIGDKLIDAKKITFYNGTEFNLRVSWFDVDPELFLGCRVFKEGDQVIARAIFGNWSLTAGESITLDPQLTTVKPPDEDGFVENTAGGYGDWAMESYFKFDISAIAGLNVKLAVLYLWVNTETGAWDNDITAYRVTNQTWTEGNTNGTQIDGMGTDTEITGEDLFDEDDGWGDVTVTEIIDADNSASNTYSTIKLVDPDNEIDPLENTYGTPPFYDHELNSVFVGRREAGHVAHVEIKCNDASSFYQPYLEIFTEGAGAESESGATLDFTISPSDKVPDHNNDIAQGEEGAGAQIGSRHTWGEAYRDDNVRMNFDNQDVHAGDEIWVGSGFESPYWEDSNLLTYEILSDSGATGGSKDCYIPSLGSSLQVYSTSGDGTVSGTVTLKPEYWTNGRLFFRVYHSTSSNNWMQIAFDRMYISFADITEKRTTTRLRNGTQVLEYAEWDCLDYNTTLTIENIPTYFSVSQVYPSVDYTDSISSSGTLTLTNTTKTDYKIFFDTSFSIHNIHFSHYYPDNLGSLAGFDEVRWFLNGSQVEHNDYELFSGTYSLEIYDYYDQLIKSDTITLTSSEDYLARYEVELPIYFVSVVNLDENTYNVSISLDGVTGAQKTVPPAVGEWFRLYGTESGVDYTITVYNIDSQQIQETTTHSQKLASSALPKLNYRAGDLWDEITGGSGGGGIISVVSYQIKENWTTYAILIMVFIVMVLSMTKDERAPSKKPKRPVRQQEREKHKQTTRRL